MMAIPSGVQWVLQTLIEAGFEAWCVGGCVRDRILGMIPQDWDVTTSAKPEETIALFGACAFPTGLQHGTVTVKAGDDPVEVTTFRRDGAYLDGRHPDHVEFTTSLEEDLSRRDFTVNAMAMAPGGRIVDPFGGQEDLKKGCIRCVGEPEKRFCEDALRMMRGLRFAAVLGFSIEEETARAIVSHKDLLRAIAVERIQVELSKLICGKDAAEILLNYHSVLSVVIPEIAPAVGFDQRNQHHCYPVWEHCVRAMAEAPAQPLLRYVMLLHDLGKPSTFTVDEDGVGHFYDHGRRSAELAEEICRRLKLDNESRTAIVELVRLHDAPIAMTEKAVKRMLRRIGETQLRRLLIVKRCDNLAQHPDYLGRQALISQLEDLLELVLRQDSCFSLKQLAVNGNDLLALGLSGKEIGETLERLLDGVVDGEMPNERDYLLSLVKEERK